MKKFRYLYLFLIIAVAVPSCVEDTAPEDAFGEGPNIASFSNTGTSFSAVTDGGEYSKTFNMLVKGPSMSSVTGDVVATLSIDPSSTAEEGVHFRMENKTITLSKENDYLGVVEVVMLTEGIQAPLDENPVLVLNVSNVDASGNVIANGKPLTITFNYLCYADLTGTYEVVINHTRCQNAPYAANFPMTMTITANPDGSWALQNADAGFLGWCTGNAGFENPGNIVVVCGVVQPSDDLEYGELGIGNPTGGTWDEATGTLVVEHAQTFTPNWPSAYTSTWVRQ